MGGMTIRVVLADDSLIVRAGLVRLLEADGCLLVAEVGDAEALRRSVALEAPDVAVVDIRSGLGGQVTAAGSARRRGDTRTAELRRRGRIRCRARQLQHIGALRSA
jgi:DNA-binding NarL/FixJ family response regulator